MIQARTALVKWVRSVRISKLIDGNQCLATERPDNVVGRARVFIDDRSSPEEVLVPGSASSKVSDGQGDVRDARKYSHESLLRKASSRSP